MVIHEFLCTVGAFEDDDVTHVEGNVDPIRDLGIISEELRLKDEQNLTKLIVSQNLRHRSFCLGVLPFHTGRWIAG